MNVTAAAVVFWGCLALLTYTYVGYPLILAVLKPGKCQNKLVSRSLPKVSVMVAAYNEEECIAQKIKNTFAQAYPPISWSAL